MRISLDKRKESIPAKRKPSNFTVAAQIEVRDLKEVMSKKKFDPYQVEGIALKGEEYKGAKITTLKNISRKIYLDLTGYVKQNKLPYEVTTRVDNGVPTVYVAAA